jgi:hypothetical protein
MPKIPPAITDLTALARTDEERLAVIRYLEHMQGLVMDSTIDQEMADEDRAQLLAEVTRDPGQLLDLAAYGAA